MMTKKFAVMLSIVSEFSQLTAVKQRCRILDSDVVVSLVSAAVHQLYTILYNNDKNMIQYEFNVDFESSV